MEDYFPFERASFQDPFSSGRMCDKFFLRESFHHPLPKVRVISMEAKVKPFQKSVSPNPSGKLE